MKLLFASSEVVPFSKTGGLADVAGALPIEVSKLGAEVAVFTPAYDCLKNGDVEFKDIGLELSVMIGQKEVGGRILKSTVAGGVTVYAIDQPHYFSRSGLYGEDGQDYPDNCERFVFFCRGIMESIRLMDWWPDLIHANDWQTSLLPVYLKTEFAETPGYKDIVSLLTIHNLAYQGSFWHWDMLLTGLDWKHFNWQEMEFYGRLNLLKSGIAFADAINTVSPTYAAEIQIAELGCGLEGILGHRSGVLSGILNGIDSADWNPQIDRHIPVNYDVNSWSQGKAACKTSLLKLRGLEYKKNVPLIGIIGRMASQKGWSLILQIMQHWLRDSDVQWMILGTGQSEYENGLAALAKSYPDKLSLELGFSNELAHQIEAAADIFLMPSEYEPCGLNQQYSLAYGTIPVVRSTGGLTDTVVDATQENIINGIANGFRFDDFEAEQLNEALTRAVDTFYHHPQIWEQLVKCGMSQDWSWASGARKYYRLYEKTVARELTTSHG